MNNELLIRRFNKIKLPQGQSSQSIHKLINLLANFERIGFSCSEQLCTEILKLSDTQFDEFYKNTLGCIKKMYGAHVKYKPMYPNFPQQVYEMSESELYQNAFAHYLGDFLGIRLLPEYQIEPRKALNKRILNVLDLADGTELTILFSNLLNTKKSLNQQDHADLIYLIRDFGSKGLQYLPEKFQHKEVQAIVSAQYLSLQLWAVQQLQLHVQTSTDVLRIYVALSDGDVSLAEPCKLISLKKSQRRILLTLLENCLHIQEDLFRYPEPWKRVIERIHPFSYQKHFPKTCIAFQHIFENKKPERFSQKIEIALQSHQFEDVVKLLKQRPGEFARRLQHCLKQFPVQQQQLLDAFKTVIDAVPIALLFQIKHYFLQNRTLKYRIFFLKGQSAKVFAIKNNLAPLSAVITTQITTLCEQSIIQRFSKLSPLGACYLDDQLKNYSVPFAQRAASKALKTIAAGSRLALDIGNTVRFFIYWKDTDSERVDIDLSALVFDAEHTVKATIAFYNLKESFAVHSGDITSAPKGASEFIDIDISKALSLGIRYVMMSINSYTQQNYCDLPICFAGFMMREDAQQGQIYEPTTVQHKFDVTSKSSFTIPLIIDLEKREVIWTDLAMTATPSIDNTVFGHLSSMSLMQYAMTEKTFPNLYDLFDLHIRARGQRVTERVRAEHIFSVDEGIRPVDIDNILANYL